MERGLILLFEKIKSMVPRNKILLENQHCKLLNPQLKIEDIMKNQLAQKCDLDTQIRREVVQKSSLNNIQTLLFQ